MKIENYGVSLLSLQKKDLEMVRTWRNSDNVRLNMVYQQIISSEEQQRWFNSLHPENDLYFILFHQENPIGLINLKKINWEEKSAESGIFIGDSAYSNASIPVSASILLSEFAFYGLGLKKLLSTTLADNENAINFDKQLGYMPLNQNSSKEVIKTFCTRENFEVKTNKIRSILHRKYGDSCSAKFHPEEPIYVRILKSNSISEMENPSGDTTQNEMHLRIKMFQS